MRFTSSAPQKRHHASKATKVLVGPLLAAALVALPTVTAAAATSQSSTSGATLTAGSLSIGTVTPETITVPVAGTGNGILPSAAWSDTTGSGDGWNGTVAVSSLTYTGNWKQTSGTTTALGATSSGAFTGAADGVVYTVTVGSGGSGTSTPYSWTSDDPTDKAGGSGTATNGAAESLGDGITIDFASGTTYPDGDTYQIHAGTQAASAISLDTSATGASITAASGTTSTAPTFVGNGTTVTGGGAGPNDYGTAVEFVSAALDTGMGTYTIDPGAQVTTDSNSWAATYTAGVQYSIVTGP